MAEDAEPVPFTYAYYECALREALAAGYRFESFARARERADANAPICLLRHDCDNDLPAAERLAEIEAAHGVASTYFVMVRSSMYNALAEPAARHLRRILELGHEIGLHFDEELVAGMPDAGLRAEVDFECALLEHYFGQPIAAVSFHRPGRRILDDTIEIGRINTYSKRDLSAYQYISDSSYLMRVDLPKALRTAHFPRLHLNLHPEWWRAVRGEVTDRWRQIVTDGLNERLDDLWAREDAFLQRLGVTLEPRGEARALPASRYYQRYEIP